MATFSSSENRIQNNVTWYIAVLSKYYNTVINVL
ncbi:MAG: hypothetical protein JWP89_2087 [Schlesneria sp.]|nr:hypothetical protein [Schlesneria sp.]